MPKIPYSQGFSDFAKNRISFISIYKLYRGVGGLLAAAAPPVVLNSIREVKEPAK